MIVHAGHSIPVTFDKIGMKTEVLIINKQNDNPLAYIKVGDYYIPDFILDNQPDKEIGIYGQMRERYLKEHHPGRYSHMLLYGTLYPHLLEIDKAAQGYLDTMIPRMADAAGVTAELKARDQMSWVGRMNAIRAQVEEMIRADLIYC